MTRLIWIAQRPLSLRLDRDLFVWNQLFRRTVRSEDVSKFRVVERADDDGKVFALVLYAAPSTIATIWSSSSQVEAQLVCKRLNEALFVVHAPPKEAPYR
jgi:hypothetical protein